MRAIEAVASRIAGFVALIGGVVIVLMMLQVSADVAMKYIFHKPITGTLEITSAYYMVALVWLPLGAVTRDHEHLEVELFTQHLAPERLAWFKLFGCVVGGIYAAIMCVQGIQEAWHQTEIREVWETATFDIPVFGARWFMPLGTFLAGVVLANSEYRHELESDIDPFRGLLLGLFFMTVGAGINFALLFDDFALILALTLGLIAAKMAVLYVLSFVFRVGGADRWLFSLGLAQAGEFGFVLLSFTVANAVIPGDLADRLLLVVALSMLLTPALFILYDRVVAPRFSEAEEREMDAIDEASDIIIAGHGRVGGIVARMLRGAGLTPTVIDFSARQLEMLKKFDVQAYYGDATRPDLLHAAGIEHAKLLVIAIDDKHQITELVTYVKKHYPDVHVIARAVDRPHVYDLWWAGCRDIIRETYDSSLRMSRSAVEALGYSRDQADRVTEMFAEMDRSAMLIAAEHYDPAISILDNEAYIEGLRAARGDIEAEFLRDAQAILAEGRKARA